MKTYKISELVPGQMYKCRLSGLTVLFEKVITEVQRTFSGDVPLKFELAAMYYNPVSGTYMRFRPADDQLTDL